MLETGAHVAPFLCEVASLFRPDLFLKNLDHWIAEEPLFNVVDPSRGY